MEFEEGVVSGGKRFAVQNKSAAPVQITAEQLLHEAVERQAAGVRAPRQRIVEEEELQEYRVKKRKDYEDALRRQRHSIGIWIKYAEWEAGQKDFRRARSVFERALQIDFQNIGLWSKYISMEVKNKFVQSARNLYDRATGILPRVDQFWFKYAHMEELLGNYAGARAIFERWIEWIPEERAWMMYVHFEERCEELERARRILERFLEHHPSEESFLRFSKFEERHRDPPRARAGFEKAIELLPLESLSENFFIRFAEFEAKQKEFQRAKAVYTSALARLPAEKCPRLHDRFVQFQKQTGTREDVEEVVLAKRRKVYEAELLQNPRDYDAWFDYVRLEESAGDVDRIREVYERAVAQVPPIMEKKYWKRYVYLWINYAIFEELDTENFVKAREVWDTLIDTVPHKTFSFAKIWLYYAEFEIRRLEIDRARKIFGRAIGECGKEKIFEAYAALELRLGNLDRCRTAFSRFIEMHSTNPKSWIAMIELELMAEEIDRARAICEAAVQMEVLDMPELVWKAYIDLECSHGTVDAARNLYQRLMEKSQHVKVLEAFAEFEATHGRSVAAAREVLELGLQSAKAQRRDHDRAEILALLVSLESRHGTPESRSAAQKRLPKRITKRRHVVDDSTGEEQGWEEYTAFEFPEDDAESSTLKLLEAAKLWKRKKLAATAS